MKVESQVQNSGVPHSSLTDNPLNMVEHVNGEVDQLERFFLPVHLCGQFMTKEF